jgi:hypothetical protein
MLVFVSLLLLFAGGYLAARGLSHERHAYLLRCHRVETAAAPGEPVVVDNQIVSFAMRRLGSPQLKQQMVEVTNGVLPDVVLRQREIILVATPGDSLLETFRARGFSVSPMTWEMPAGGCKRPGAGISVFFVVAPAVPQSSDSGSVP